MSVVLPTYNEAASILRFLAELRGAVEAAGIDAELLLVDDASPDGTADRVAAERDDVRVLRRGGPRGLAFSVRDGVEQARGERLVVMDSDFNHDPQAVPSLLAALDGCDLASGSRFVPGGGMYSVVRQAGSWAMNLLIRIVLRTPVRDNLSGFFAVRRADLGALPADVIYEGHGDYYFRLLFLAREHGLHIREVPVRYRSREGGGSKTPLLRTSVRYSAALLRFRPTARAFRNGALRTRARSPGARTPAAPEVPPRSRAER